MDPAGQWSGPSEVAWSGPILVPFAPETPKSGIGYRGLCRVFWYRRRFKTEIPENGRVLLHFEAVDYSATVWVNGTLVAVHEGGYTPFTCEITGWLSSSEQEVVVRAEDDPADLQKPRGKQDWQLDPHSIWYPRTSGIWRTVWLEQVAQSYIASVQWTPNRERWEIAFEIHVEGQHEPLHVELRLAAGDETLAQDTYSVIQGEVYRRISLSDPGIDDFRNELLWRPTHPKLIDASLKLRDESGAVIDEVESYTALRSIGIQGSRFVLNGAPLALSMVLDQGYWPESGLTAPDDNALRRDVELAKAMGFNGVRKHQKIEDPRYLFWADKLGLLVWEEMPSAYRYTHVSIRRVTHEWMAAMVRDMSHPCIIAWVPFNESWGVPDLPDSAAQRHYVQALYHLTKTMDPNRPVIGNDGWESIATDLIGIHDYDANPSRLAMRYSDGKESEVELLTRERPGGRLLVLKDAGTTGQPIVLSEFGGIAFSKNERGTWGYSRCRSPEELAQRYRELVAAIRALPLLAGFCYTQFTDTYQEANGLLYADRTPKIPLAEIAQANSAGVPPDERVDSVWRNRLMELQRHIHRLTEES